MSAPPMTANLLSRLQGLKAPDREVDALIWAHFAGVRYVSHNPAYSSSGNNPLTQVEFRTPPKRTSFVTLDSGPYQHATPVTASLDAAVALCERVLPGYGWTVDKSGGRGFAGVGQSFNEEAATPAIALLIAILTALEARDAS